MGSVLFMDFFLAGAWALSARLGPRKTEGGLVSEVFQMTTFPRAGGLFEKFAFVFISK